MKELDEIRIGKQIDVGKITAMLAVIACIAGAPSWAGAVINVPGDAATIAAAIATATAGDTIVVAAGTYTENVVLDKGVSLEGAQAGVDACGRDGTGETIIDASAGIGIRLVAGSAGATIDGFTIIDATNAIESSSGPIDGVTIQNNRMPDFTSTGIFLNDKGDDITLHQNSVDGSSQTGSGGIVHLDQDPFDGMHVTDNCIVNGATGLFSDGTRNVGMSAGRSPLMSGNLVSGNGTGANLGRKSWEDAAISDNVFVDNGFDGLQGGPASSAITGNVFANNGRHGLALTGFGGGGDATRGAQDNDINSNCIVGNGTTGVLYSSSQFPGTQATNMVNGNNIRGNATGASYAGTETLDATANWWGASDGPSAPDGSGSGDSVDGASGGGSIDFSSFETANLDLPCNDFFPPIYSCVGFEPPMNLAYKPPALGGGLIARKVKRNRVLPYKATLVDEDGNIVTDLMSPPVIQVLYEAVPMGGAVDVTDDALVNGKGTDGNQFELAGDTWQFNLKTKNYSSTGTYTGSMLSGDPAEYVVDPSCEGVFVIGAP
jgi:hypothetical protein